MPYRTARISTTTVMLSPMAMPSSTAETPPSLPAAESSLKRLIGLSIIQHALLVRLEQRAYGAAGVDTSNSISQHRCDT